jgi:serine protease Do
MKNCIEVKKILSRATGLVIFSLFVMGWVISLNASEIDYKLLYNKTAKAVVLLYGTDGKIGSKGTGSIIDKSGLVLTNTHVVVQKGKLWKKQYVFLKPDQVTGNSKNDLKKGFAAEVLAVNPKHDLALVQIVKPPADLPVLPLSDLANIDIGEPTIAIGHPAGGASWTLTTGKISASWHNYNNIKDWEVFQTETSLNPGNSGGPLLDGSGAIIGINTFIVRKGHDNMALTGLNFAVKSTTARNWIAKVIGKLPPASQARAEDSELPSAEKVDKAKVPKESAKQSKSFFRKNRSAEKRSVELAKPGPREQKYSHSSAGRPGTVFSGRKLDTLEKIRTIHKIFEENSFNN